MQKRSLFAAVVLCLASACATARGGAPALTDITAPTLEAAPVAREPARERPKLVSSQLQDVTPGGDSEVRVPRPRPQPAPIDRR